MTGKVANRELMRLRGDITVMKHHGLNPEEIARLEKRIALIEEMDAQLKASAEIIRKALDAR